MRLRTTGFTGIVLSMVLMGTSAQARPVAQTPLPPVLISALHYFGYEANEDEAVRLTNASAETQVLDGAWSLRDDGNHSYSFTVPITLVPGAHAWVAGNEFAFARQFGFSPTQTYNGRLVFANTGGSVQLITQTSMLMDTANADGGGWNGGSGSPTYISMERKDAGAPDAPSNWGGAIASLPAVRDFLGYQITGTPRALNSIAVTPTTPTTLTVIINEVAWAGTRADAFHEWIELFNNTSEDMSLDGWQLEVSNGNVVPLAGIIAAQGFYLVQDNPNTFGAGVVADTRGSFSLSNSGAVLRLVNARSTIVDTLVYGAGSTATTGWGGRAVLPYTVSHTIVDDGQVLMRKLPLRDSDTAGDWINNADDVVDGRRAIYPAWRFDEFGEPVRASSHITIAVAPDASFDVLSAYLNSAHTTIDLETYSFESAAIAELLHAKILAGVRVRVLLDGSPVGGLPEQTKWACQRISTVASSPQSGCWFMRSDDAQKIHKRYTAFHAKFAIVDGSQLSVASENLSPNGYPDDDKRDGTVGQRGLLAILDAPALVARAQAIWNADLGYRDMVRFGADPRWSGPTGGFVPITITGGTTYTARFTQPLVLATRVTVELSTSPETNLRGSSGIIPLLQSLGPGDSVAAEQLSEPYFWGDSDSDPKADPNVRLQAVISATQRGAQAWMLLDRYYADSDATRGNYATAQYLRGLRAQNGWNLNVALGNPTARGIHNKAWLIRRNGVGYAQIGSWNGTEVSAKLNREMTVLIESDAVYEYLSRMFWSDWHWSNPAHLPAVMNNYAAPVAITHALISEVMYDPIGLDDGREWIELYNPTASALDLTGYKIGDAELRGRSSADGMFAFPNGTTIPAGGVLVVAQNALLFASDYQHPPDFEMTDYDPLVPNLSPYLPWSNGAISLNNAGDQVLLLGPDDSVVDAVQWGISIALASPIAYTQPITSGHSLQRWPPNIDTDNCAVDFRDQIAPSPGRVP